MSTLILHLNLAFFGFLGFLAREGFTRLCAHQGPLNGVLWSNFTGSLWMGYINKHPFVRSSNISHRSSSKKKADFALYTALTTGFAGSLTTFSSFILESFVLGANIVPPPKLQNGQPISSLNYPAPGWGTPMTLAYILTTLCVSLGGYICGQHLASMFLSVGTVSSEKSPKPASFCRLLVTPFSEGLTSKTITYLEYFVALLGGICYALVLALAIASEVLRGGTRFNNDWRFWLFGLIFTPPAVFLRYWLCRINPKIFPDRFPVGTFACNIIATALLGGLSILQRGGVEGSSIVRHIQHGTIKCDMVLALEDGFCGSLSTISTFIAELYKLRLKNLYIYGFISVTVAFGCMVITFGSYIWTHGINEHCYV